MFQPFDVATYYTNIHRHSLSSSLQYLYQWVSSFYKL